MEKNTLYVCFFLRVAEAVEAEVGEEVSVFAGEGVEEAMEAAEGAVEGTVEAVEEAVPETEDLYEHPIGSEAI